MKKQRKTMNKEMKSEIKIAQGLVVYFFRGIPRLFIRICSGLVGIEEIFLMNNCGCRI